VDEPQGLRPELFRIACVLENHCEYLDRCNRLDRIEIAGWRDLACRCPGARGLPARGPCTWVQTGDFAAIWLSPRAVRRDEALMRRWPQFMQDRSDLDSARARSGSRFSQCGCSSLAGHFPASAIRRRRNRPPSASDSSGVGNQVSRSLQFGGEASIENHSRRIGVSLAGATAHAAPRAPGPTIVLSMAQAKACDGLSG